MHCIYSRSPWHHLFLPNLCSSNQRDIIGLHQLWAPKSPRKQFVYTRMYLFRSSQMLLQWILIFCICCNIIFKKGTIWEIKTIVIFRCLLFDFKHFEHYFIREEGWIKLIYNINHFQCKQKSTNQRLCIYHSLRYHNKKSAQW